MKKVNPYQPSLEFPPSRARNTDPATSKKAASVIRPGSIRALILNTLNQGDFATYQIALILDKDRDAISPHMKPLEQMGEIERTGQTIQRPKTLKECEVWRRKKRYL